MEFKTFFLDNYIQILGILQAFYAKVNLEGLSLCLGTSYLSFKSIIGRYILFFF